MFLCTKAEAASETSLPIYPTTHCNILDDWLLYQYGNVSFKSRYYKPDEFNLIKTKDEKQKRWAGHVARMGEDRGVHRVLVGKPEGKRPLGRRRRRWEDNIKMNLYEVGGGRGDWMELA
jgi:hypothetical protein